MAQSISTNNSVQIGEVGCSVPRRSGHVWGYGVSLVAYLLFIWLSEFTASSHRDHYSPPSQLVYVSFD